MRISGLAIAGLALCGAAARAFPQEPDEAPADFAIDGFFGSRACWGANGSLAIGPDGKGRFHKALVNEKGETREFALDKHQLSAIYAAVIRNKFFELKEKYDSGACDGSGCSLRVAAGGKTHNVETANQAVEAFDRICFEINTLLPPECRIFYGELPSYGPGQAVKGLLLLAGADREAVREGEAVTLTVRVKNCGDGPIRVLTVLVEAELSPSKSLSMAVTDAGGATVRTAVHGPGPPPRGGGSPYVDVAAGKELVLRTVELKFKDGRYVADYVEDFGLWRYALSIASPGEYRISFTYANRLVTRHLAWTGEVRSAPVTVRISPKEGAELK